RKEVRPFDFDVAMAASPVPYRGKVLLLCDQVGRSSRLIAFDGKTGDVSWEKPRPTVGFSHSTPLLLMVGGRAHLLGAAADALQGLDPDNGEVLWWCRAVGDASSPAGDARVVYADNGRSGPGVAVAPTGKGDVTKAALWSKPGVPSTLSSPVLVGDHF